MSKSPYRRACVEHARDPASEVKEPSHPTEFEVQATLWTGLRELGINARGEVKAAFAGRAVVRFDVAVFDDLGALVGLLECKRNGKDVSKWAGTRQGHRYGQFGVPVRVICGMQDATRALADAEAGELFGADG